MNSNTTFRELRRLDFGAWRGPFCILLFFSQILMAAPKENLFSRDFNLYEGRIPGIDFLASDPSEYSPLEAPLSEVRSRLQLFLGGDFPDGAIFICSSTEQRDAIYEPRALRMGYEWVVMMLNPSASAREMTERIRTRSGGEIPAEQLERIRNRTAAMQARVVEQTLLEVGFAILTTQPREKPFKYSRLEDMNRSPLADWLDIGIAYYAAQATPSKIAYLNRRTGEMFSIEDILTMSRPFVLPAAALGETISGDVRMAPGAGTGAPPVQAGARNSRGPAQEASVPKDVRDRSMFDAQSAALFAYLLDRLDTGKVKELIDRNRGGEESDSILGEDQFLGNDFEAIERAWLEWIQSQGGGNRKPQERTGRDQISEQRGNSVDK